MQTQYRNLFRHDWTAIDRFVDDELVRELAAEARMLWSRGHFRQAGIGKGADQVERDEIRRDMSCWFADDPLPAQRELLQKLDQLRQAFNAYGYLGLVDVECHFARYGIGDFYAKHYDRFRADDRRVVSAVLYLNEHWGEADGGELRLVPRAGGAVSVVPRAGTLALFLSEHVEHEVLPAKRERLSVAAWFRRRGVGTLA